jgi:hypothetical protein
VVVLAAVQRRGGHGTFGSIGAEYEDGTSQPGGPQRRSPAGNQDNHKTSQTEIEIEAEIEAETEADKAEERECHIMSAEIYAEIYEQIPRPGPC